MTTKHSYRTGRIVALAAALAALSAPIVSVAASQAASAKPSMHTTRPAAAKPASAAPRPAAARLMRATLATFDLCARAGTTTMPNGAVVPVWGYEPGDCSAASTITRPGGPVIGDGTPGNVVTAGDVVTVVLHNGLTEATSLLFQGQAIPPDTPRTTCRPDHTVTPRSGGGAPACS